MEVEAPVTAGMLREFVAHMDRRLDTLHLEMRDGFAHVATRFEQVDRRFEQVDRRFEQVDRRFDRLEERLLAHDRALLSTTRYTVLTAGVALAVSLFALLR